MQAQRAPGARSGSVGLFGSAGRLREATGGAAASGANSSRGRIGQNKINAGTSKRGRPRRALLNGSN